MNNSYKKLDAAKRLKSFMADHFYELDAAAKTGEKKIAWCTSVGPAELLRALGFLVYFPENHGAILGSTRTATDYIPLANAIGYSPDICSYLTSDVGSYLAGETPLSKIYPGIETIPIADVLVYNTNQCREVKDWFDFYARRWNVPILGIETYNNVGNITEAHIVGIVGQLETLVSSLEQISGNKMDVDRLKEVVALSAECSRLWERCLRTAANIPSPFTFFDGSVHMGPAVVARGTEEANEYYRLLLAELQARVKNKVAAVNNEKFRLYWEGMPIWGKLRQLATLFIELRSCVVASTYCNSWIFSALDPERPFESIARAYTEIFIARDERHKESYIDKMLKLYKADGIVFHDSKTCAANTNCRYGMAKRYQERGVPAVVINGDLNDLRCYSEEQTVTNIEAFIEQLEAEKLMG